MYLLDLKKHKQILKDTFSTYHKTDFTIDCILAGNMCCVYADCREKPSVFLIKNGPFYILGGDPYHKNAQQILEQLPHGANILPSPEAWITKLKESKQLSLKTCERFILDHTSLSIDKLNEFINYKNDHYSVEKINHKIAQLIENSDQFNYHLQNFNSIDDFLKCGTGYAVQHNSAVIAVASSALVCQKGIEINIMVLPQYRNKALALRLAAHLIKDTLINENIPHWDAANNTSKNLAQKLGYTFIKKYDAFKIIKDI